MQISMKIDYVLQNIIHKNILKNKMHSLGSFLRKYYVHFWGNFSF